MRFSRNTQSAKGDMENKPNILFENDAVLVIDKPAGLIVHSDGRTEEPSVAEWVVAQYPHMRGVGEPWTSPQGEVIDRPGIMHRLDRTTSGVMILAKTQEAHAFLKQQFQERTTQKVYDALVYGHNKEDTGTIEAEIGRSRQHPKRWSAQFGKKGNLRAAVTDWRVLLRGVDPESGERVMHLECMPKTGRTHQIRVHLKAIHHPIICDHIYAEGRPCLFGLQRPALHARALTIAIAVADTRTFEAPLPRDLAHAIDKLKKST